MASKAIQKDVLDIILAALTIENENACRVSLITGLRIGDVLGLKSEQIRQRRFVVVESKTGKKRRVTIPIRLAESILTHAGKVYAFPHRLDHLRPRTRQAVFKDLQRVSTALRLGVGVSPHSMRKCFSVSIYHATGDMKKVQALLNHSSEAVTALYCMADVLNLKKRGAGSQNGEQVRKAHKTGPYAAEKNDEREPAQNGEQVRKAHKTGPYVAGKNDEREPDPLVKAGTRHTEPPQSDKAAAVWRPQPPLGAEPTLQSMLIDELYGES